MLTQTRPRPSHAQQQPAPEYDRGTATALPRFEQPYGNAAISSSIGGEGRSDAWSPGEVADWAFGPEDEGAAGLGRAREVFGFGGDPGHSCGPAGLAGRIGLGRAGRAFDGLGERPPDLVPQSVVDWVDEHVPVGLGIAGSIEFCAMAGVSLATPFTASVVNEGGGWLTVEVTGAILFGAGAGLGAVAGDTGAEGELAAQAGPKGTRVFRVPWTRLADLGTLAKLAGSAVAGELIGVPVEGLAPAHLVEELVDGHDLTPYLMKERIEGRIEGNLGAEGGALGEELGLSAEDVVSGALEVEYDDLADAHGMRKGRVRIEARKEVLVQIAADLSKTIGVDTTCAIPDFDGHFGLVVPFVERDGDKTFAAPYVEVGGSLGAGPLAVEGAVELGPGHAGVKVAAEVDPGSLLWQKALDGVAGSVLETLTFGICEIETSGSMKLGLEASLDHPLLAEAASIAGDVVRWIGTGDVSDTLAPHLAVVQELVESADLKLGVDLEIFALHADGSLEGAAGVQVGGEAEGKVGLVYQRDDVLGDLEPVPTVAELLPELRRNRLEAK